MSKNIVICCDGTGNTFCDHNSNVAILFELLENHTERQIAYYDPGVGTLGATFTMTKFGDFVTKAMGQMFAFGIQKNIEDAYRFLMDNFEKGDKIFLFGFSRGAFTVRALSGMLHKCGLLHEGSINLIRHVSKLYKDKKVEDKVVEEFRDAFCRKAFPYFIGVWDTVESVGRFANFVKHTNSYLDKNVKYGYHALSIDEKRRKFKPKMWQEPNDDQTMEQVWFPGVHSDIGGSYKEIGLSNIALHWMIDKATDNTKEHYIHLKDGILAKKHDALVQNCKCKKHISFKWYWRILLRSRRRIPENALVHECAYQKMVVDPNYKPKNLPEKSKVRIVSTPMSKCQNMVRLQN